MSGPAGSSPFVGLRLDLSEEDAGYVMSALEHHHWARGFLRRVDPEARRRFSDAGWAYGDPTYMGGAPEQLYDSQLDSVLAAVFPSLSGEVLIAVGEEIEPGLILDAETGEPLGDPEYGLPAVDWVVFALFRGRTPADINEFERGLRLSMPEREIFRRRVDEPADRHNAVLVIDAQWGPDETIYYELFEGLIKAREALDKEEERPRAERNSSRRRREARKALGEGPRGQARGRGRGLAALRSSPSCNPPPQLTHHRQLPL